MEKKEDFDERYHASYTAKLKTIPLENLEHAIAKALGGLTGDRVECTILNFNAEEKCAKITITLDLGKDKRYSR
ncbi:MAG: hypothetical protein ABFD97_15640 [Syntrophobacter sp.]